MTSNKKLIFYDLAFYPGAPLASPNTWFTRLCLLHKAIPFETVECTLSHLQDRSSTSLYARLGGRKPLCPILEVVHLQPSPADEPGPPHSEFIHDSLAIALYLDEHHPIRPLFQPTLERADLTHPTWPTTLALATALKHGFATSDSTWNKFFELAAPGLSDIADRASQGDGVYFRSDERHGKQGFRKIVAMDLPLMVAETRRSLVPFEAVLQLAPAGRPAFLTAPNAPGIVDYMVLSRYAMLKAADPHRAEAVVAPRPDAARSFLEKLGMPVQEETGEWLGDVDLDRVAEWKERMLDLFDGAPRAELSRPGPRSG